MIRQALDGLNVPWCAIVGDHDVEGKSFEPFRASLAEQTHYAFMVGNVRFLALNAFDQPDPKSFTVGREQLAWAEKQVRAATAEKQEKVLLLHCYPSDLKEGGDELTGLIRKRGVRLVDMGHTHYNEDATLEATTPLRVEVTDAAGNTAVDEIQIFVGPNRPTRHWAERDQDNALEAWPAHGLPGTQLGPNKNGRKR